MPKLPPIPKTPLMWVWSKLSSIRWEDAWEERFYGNQNAVITLIKGGKSVRVEVYCGTEPEAQAIASHFGGSVRELKTRNWAELSGKIPKPLLIRNALVITQESRDSQMAALQNQYPGRVLISIPPEMAFGTGDHATTSTVLRFLVDEARARQPGWSCLDLGTGTGILAIAAQKLGAEKIAAYDYDPKAVEVTAENFRRNQVKHVLLDQADVTTWKNKTRYDLIAANLFSDVLIEILPRLKTWLAPHGTALLSGILHTQWPAVRETAETSGLTVARHLKKGKWVSAILKENGGQASRL